VLLRHFAASSLTAVRASVTFRHVFSRVSLAWGIYLLLRSAVRLLTLSWRDVDLIVAVNVLTGMPFTAAVGLRARF